MRENGDARETDRARGASEERRVTKKKNKKRGARERKLYERMGPACREDRGVSDTVEV